MDSVERICGTGTARGLKLRREIGKLRDKTKFSENQNPNPHHEGAYARPRDMYLRDACL
jgi:hypothetical protein